MSVPEILICEGYLTSLRDEIRTAMLNLQSGGHIPFVSFDGAPEVDEAVRWMGDKWDEHRNGLTDNLRGLYDALTVTIDSFTRADAALANPSSGDSK